MQATQKLKTLKVTFRGETKRIKIGCNFAALVTKAKESFGASLANQPDLKFYYLDEENEVISITHQNDLKEAFESDPVQMPVLKLIIASNVNDAREQLLRQLEDSRALNESMSQSQIGGFMPPLRSSRTQRDDFSDFDKISHCEFIQTEPIDMRRATVGTINPMSMPGAASHEIACGSDEQRLPISQGTDIQDFCHKADVGSNTARVQTHDQMIDTCVNTQTQAIQAESVMKDMGCDSIKAATTSQGIQMDVHTHDTQVACHLLIPDENESQEEVLEQEVTCFKCNGSQVNKKGLPCRKCKGSGVLVSNQLGEMTEIIKQDVAVFCKEHIKTMFADYIKAKRSEQDKVTHEEIECDGCAMNPITGLRFKCAVCPDYDLCQVCERKGVHANTQHPMLKIRKPLGHNFRIVCQPRRQPSFERPQSLLVGGTACGPAPQTGADSFVKRVPAPSMEQSQHNERYSGRFVRESMKEFAEVLAGSNFSKTFTFRNDGNTVWPRFVRLCHSSGDSLSLKEAMCLKEVHPNEEVDLTVQCKAPEAEGRYTDFFRLQTGPNVKFGQKCWISIQVIKPKAQVAAAAQEAPVATNSVWGRALAPQKPEPVQMVSQDTGSQDAIMAQQSETPQFIPEEEKPKFESKAVNDLYNRLGNQRPWHLKEQPQKPAAKPDCSAFAEDKSSQKDLYQSTISNQNVTSPKEIYMHAASLVDNAQLRESLISLYEFGFIDFYVNEKLLKKYKDVNAVAEKLCTLTADQLQRELL